MANGLDAAEALNLVSPPGTGKTTTLVQLSGALLQAGHVVAVVVPLGEWSDRREDFFTFLTRRNDRPGVGMVRREALTSVARRL